MVVNSFAVRQIPFQKSDQGTLPPQVLRQFGARETDLVFHCRVGVEGDDNLRSFQPIQSKSSIGPFTFSRWPSGAMASPTVPRQLKTPGMPTACVNRLSYASKFSPETTAWTTCRSVSTIISPSACRTSGLSIRENVVPSTTLPMASGRLKTAFCAPRIRISRCQFSSWKISSSDKPNLRLLFSQRPHRINQRRSSRRNITRQPNRQQQYQRNHEKRQDSSVKREHHLRRNRLCHKNSSD